MLLKSNVWKKVRGLSHEALIIEAEDLGVDHKRVIKEYVSKIDPRNGTSKAVLEKKMVELPKTTLVRRVEDVMTLIADIPKELWTEEQKEAFINEGVEQISEGARQMIEREAIGIHIKFRGAPVEVTREQGKYILDKLNQLLIRTDEPLRTMGGEVTTRVKWLEGTQDRIVEVDAKKPAGTGEEVVDETTCRYCGKVNATKGGRGAHERFCSKNPKNFKEKLEEVAAVRAIVAPSEEESDDGKTSDD